MFEFITEKVDLLNTFVDNNSNIISNLKLDD